MITANHTSSPTTRPPTGVAAPAKKPKRIRVPTRMIQGGLDCKFDANSNSVQLHGILAPDEYRDAIDRVNQWIRPARSNALDTSLLITGPLLVPLALWGVRHSWHVKKRKRLLAEAIHDFHETYPDHLMKWNQGAANSFLTIEWRDPPPMEEEKNVKNMNMNNVVDHNNQALVPWNAPPAVLDQQNSQLQQPPQLHQPVVPQQPQLYQPAQPPLPQPQFASSLGVPAVPPPINQGMPPQGTPMYHQNIANNSHPSVPEGQLL